MTALPFAATTPVSVGRVGLRSRDAEALAAYYRSLLGFEEMRRDGDVIALGAGGRELLEIEGSSALKLDDPRSAGLYHTAFLLPARRDLALWLRHAADNGIRVEGASDHDVSEAVYLTDPEGNGIEIYADRAPETWSFDDGAIRMGTVRLNVPDLLSEIERAPGTWSGAPEGTVVGHVHLRVGEVASAENWWNDVMHLDTMLHYANAAVFLSSGGYHHHIASNIWQSRGAGPRDHDHTGLAFVELRDKDGERPTVSDPWGTQIRTVAA